MLFADLGKEPRDLLAKEYPDDRSVEAKMESKSENGVENIAIVNLAGKGSLQLKWKHCDYKFSTTCETGPAHLFKWEVAFPQRSGVKLTAKGSCQAGKSDPQLSLEGEYNRDAITIDGKADLLKSKGPLFSFAGLYSANVFNLGASAQYQVVNGKMDQKLLHVGGQFTHGAHTATVFAKKSESVEVGLEYLHKVNDNTTIALTSSTDPSSRGLPKNIAFGGSHKIDKSTTLRAKFNHEGVFSLCAIHQLTQFTKANTGVTYDSSKGDFKVGLAFKTNY